MATLTVGEVLCVPLNETKFRYLSKTQQSQIYKKYERLRVERRGLRIWASFKDSPVCLQSYLGLYCSYPKDWKPHVTEWQRYGSSERIVQDLYCRTLIERVNVALDAVVQPEELSIIGPPKQFTSWGTESSIEGEKETKIAPDWVVMYGDLTTIDKVQNNIIAWGDTKLCSSETSAALPGTIACLESHLAQVVQYCIDQNVPFGFVLTNVELIVFHVIMNDDKLERHIATRSSHPSSSELLSLPSKGPREPIYSSPDQRSAADWNMFTNGDNDIPLLLCDGNNPKTALKSPSAPACGGYEPLVPALHQVSQPSFSQARELRPATPEPPNSSQQSSLHPGSSPCLPDPRGHRDHTSTNSPLLSSSEPPTTSSIGSSPLTPSSRSDLATERFVRSSPFNPSPYSTTSLYTPDPRSRDASYVLIKSYPSNKAGVAQRLFELCMLAKMAKDNGVSKIGPNRISFTSFDALNNVVSPP